MLHLKPRENGLIKQSEASSSAKTIHLQPGLLWGLKHVPSTWFVPGSMRGPSKSPRGPFLGLKQQTFAFSLFKKRNSSSLALCFQGIVCSFSALAGGICNSLFPFFFIILNLMHQFLSSQPFFVSSVMSSSREPGGRSFRAV